MKKYSEFMQNVNISKDAQARVLQKALSANAKPVRTPARRFIPAVAAAVLVIGIGAFAAGNLVTNWYASSSSNPDYTSLPTEKRCVKDVGFEPILISEFSNGYKFADGSVVKNELGGEDGSTVEKFKSLDFRYKKGGDTLYFTQEKYSADAEQAGEIAASKDGTDYYFYSYKNKVVPPDYKLTDEDKAAEESGELVFSYGSDEVRISTVSTVRWQKGDMHFSLMQIDGKLTKDEMLDTAFEAE